MPGLRIDIVRYTDDAQPGWVECRFADLHGRVRSFVEKVPLVADEYLDAQSVYPRTGVIACEVLARSGGSARVAVSPISDYFECDVP